MGRKKDKIWEYAEKKGTHGHFECKFCKLSFAGGATRIREHLAGSPNIRVCKRVPPDVHEKARSVERIKKRSSESTSTTGLQNSSPAPSAESSASSTCVNASSGAFLAPSAEMGEPLSALELLRSEEFGMQWEWEVTESLKSTDDWNSTGRFDYLNLYD